MIVGSVDERILAPTIAGIEGRLGRPVNYVLYPRDEVEERIGREGDFIHEVFTGKRLLLKGKDDDPLFEAH